MTIRRGYRLAGSRLSRRQALRGAALGSIGLEMATLIGCGQKEKPVATTAPEAKQPKPGGVITHAGGLAGSWDTRGTTLDPHINSGLGAMGYRLFYQGLLAYDLRTYEVEPELAHKWEQPSPTEYLFTLQPGVKWQNKPPANGRELRVEDILFSLERARTNRPQFQHRILLEGVEKIEAIDKARLKVTTKEPNVATLTNLSGDGLLILVPEVVEKAGRFSEADAVVGTGPFIMKSLQESVGADYVRNPDYWKPGRPYLDAFRTRHFSSEEESYAAFLGGALDITRLTGVQVKDYLARRGSGFTPEWNKDTSSAGSVTPNTSVKPMDDARVTRALRLLIDHDEFKTAWAELERGRGQYASIFPTALDLWDLTEEEYKRFLFWKQPKDEAVREALALLSAASFTRETPLRFEVVTRAMGSTESGAVLLQGQWRRFSQGVVDVQVKPYELAVVLQIQANGSFTYGMWGIAASMTEPDSWLTQIYRSGGSRNLMRLKDPKLDAMIDKQRVTFNTPERKALVKEIVSYMAENSPGLLASNQFTLNAVKPEVRDYVAESWLSGRQYEWVWLDT